MLVRCVYVSLAQMRGLVEVVKVVLAKPDNALKETGRIANQTIELSDFGITREHLLRPVPFEPPTRVEGETSTPVLEKVIIHTEFTMHQEVIQSVSSMCALGLP